MAELATIRPNIVLFVVDQQRRDSLGCYGNTICRTPRIDALAETGIVFDQAYTTSPVCSPARASLLSGLYPHNHGVMINTHIGPAFSRGLSPEIPTFSRLLNDAGYGVDYVGKWHVHEDLSPEPFGFDRHEDLRASLKSKPESEIYVDFPRGRQLIYATQDAPVEESRAWLRTEAGITFLKERAMGSGERNPFFLRIDLNIPHFGTIVPEPYASMYDSSDIPPWPNFDETFEGKPESHRRKHLEWNLENKEWNWWQKVVAKYYGEVSLIDTCVGRVLDAIDEAGIEDDTVFIFTADHGDSLGSHKHIEKAGTMYDEVFRIPLIIRVPPRFRSPAAGSPAAGSPAAGSPAAGSSNAESPPKSYRCKEFVRLMDLMPTILDFADLEAPDDIDGMSFVGLFGGEVGEEWPRSVYCEHHGEVWGYHSQRSIRTEEFKYVYNPTDLDEFYDLGSDPYEMHNLINDSERKAQQEDLKARLLGWNDATGDMFRWNWVRWNFPDPILPRPYASGAKSAKFRGV